MCTPEVRSLFSHCHLVQIAPIHRKDAKTFVCRKTILHVMKDGFRAQRRLADVQHMQGGKFGMQTCAVLIRFATVFQETTTEVLSIDDR